MNLNDPSLKVNFDRWYTKYPPLTPWFPHKVAPVRVGVYMVDQSWPDQVEQPVFSLWTATIGIRRDQRQMMRCVMCALDQ